MEGLGWTCNKNDEQISYRFLLLVRRTYCLIPQVILYGMGVGVVGFLIFFSTVSKNKSYAFVYGYDLFFD